MERFQYHNVSGILPLSFAVEAGWLLLHPTDAIINAAIKTRLTHVFLDICISPPKFNKGKLIQYMR